MHTLKRTGYLESCSSVPYAVYLDNNMKQKSSDDDDVDGQLHGERASEVQIK